MSLSYVQTNTLYLSGSGVIVGATTISLTSFADIYGNVLTMASFGSKGYITLEPDTTNEEAATFTGVTANANGTYTLTGVESALAQSPYTESSGLVRQHSGGTKLVITDNVAFWNTFANKNNNETILGTWVFNTAPSSLSATPASTTALGNVKLTSTPSTTLGNPTITIASPAVVTLASHGLIAGDSVQFTTTGALPTGLATSTTYYVIATGLTTNAFELSTTVGGTAVNTSGTQSGTHTLLRTTPFAVGNDDPRIPSVTTAGAFAGSVGTPSSTNKFLTQAGVYTADFDQQQATQNATSVVGQANSAGNRNIVAQSFIPTVTKIRGVRLYKSADTGSFIGSVVVSLQVDSSGSPSGVSLASFTILNASWLEMNVGEISLYFGTEYDSMVVGNTYWIVVTPSTSDSSNCINLGTTSSSSYANGLLKYNNTTDGWVTTATDLYFRTMTGVLNQTAGLDTTGLIPNAISRYGVVAVDNTVLNTTASVTNKILYAVTFPAGFFTTNNGLRFSFSMELFTSTTAKASSFIIALNGTTIFTKSLAANSTTNDYINTLTLLNTGATNTQRYIIETNLMSNASGTSTISFPSTDGTLAIDTSGECVLQVLGSANDVAANAYAKYFHSVLEHIG